MEAVEGIEKQAKRMRLESNRRFLPLKVGMCVTVPVPDVDRSKADFRNIIDVVCEVTDDNLYKIGTREGVLAQLYSRNQIAYAENNFLRIEDVPAETISLQAVNTQESIVGGFAWTFFNVDKGNRGDKIWIARGVKTRNRSMEKCFK
ncbi:hypothetical protein QAD02_007893 [Eretmocerus hayati]|uniref:Uncharacterized protein n=1 Tax=Eretmocerus hayati TaxID=131215 RepID=A0ACC2N572_9HYME|nr:hypothetical protein QAD02_007893 [Eretmocerus hayati]